MRVTSVAAAIGRQVVGLVEDDQIPRRGFEQAFDSGRSFEGVDTGDQAIMLGERVALSIGHVAFRPEHLEIEMECVVQLAPPVLHESSRYDHERTGQFAARRQLSKNQCRLDGLAQAHAVGNKKPTGRGIGDSVGQDDLVGQEIDFGCGQGRGVLQKRQLLRFDREP